MKFRFLIWVFSVFAAAVILYAGQSLLLQKEIADKTVRLHVVANSDSPADQQQKLIVRDAVLQQVSMLTSQCNSAREAKTVISDNLPLIKRAAQGVCDEEITVSLQKENFETRYYETFTLPAGEYPALRVSIGQAQGQNWWCVVFPSLCVSATSQAVEEAALTGGFTQEEAELISGGTQEYELRFMTLEWLQKLGNFLK
ncbi:MAG: stage II sporulation protein R [Oscillospiraceae bacterium]|nr:stage II sporulation protein R [Oscillospiraceae bacterium]